MEGWHGAGLAGGCHGDAHVYPELLRKREEWKGKCATNEMIRLQNTFLELFDGVSLELLFQVLLGLTDEDLQLGLGVSSLMHRRKLRLAIEDYRNAENGAG